MSTKVAPGDARSELDQMASHLTGGRGHLIPLEKQLRHWLNLQCIVVGDTDKLLAQMRRGSIEYCVLALLQGEPRYGLDITRTLSSADGLVTSEGTIYPLLTRLRRDGLVESFWQESDAGPPRRYYRITDPGRSALIAFIGQWTKFRDAVDGILSEEES
ncbi:MAG: PadR family transcriptional regulator [Actinomycetes bacterium]